MARQKIIDGAWDKIDQLPLDFDFEVEDLDQCLYDAVRETGIDPDSVTDGSTRELQLELRTVYWFIFRVKNSASTNFRYNTGADGRSVDKSMISKQLAEIMNDLNEKYEDWKQTDSSGTTSGTLWTRTRRESAKLQL